MKHQPESWFIERIGKTIFCDATTCPCLTCKQGIENGIEIHDKMHANYLYLCQNEMDIEYRDAPSDHPLKIPVYLCTAMLVLIIIYILYN